MSEQTLLLPSSLDIAAADSLLESFQRFRGAPLAVDASEVKKLGGLCLQIIISASKTWRSEKTPFTIVRPSQEFVAALKLFGFEEAFFETRESSS